MKKYILITDLDDNYSDQIEFTAQMITCTQDYEEKDNYFQPLIEYTPTKGDCLYLDSEVNIPRVKFKDLVNKGVKNVRNRRNISIANRSMMSILEEQKNFVTTACKIYRFTQMVHGRS